MSSIRHFVRLCSLLSSRCDENNLHEILDAQDGEYERAAGE